jgi:hypothetical protein
MSLGLQTVHLADANPSVSLTQGSTPDLTLIPPTISVSTPRNNTFYNVSSLVLAFNVNVTYPSLTLNITKWWTYYTADWIRVTGKEDTVLIDLQSSVTFMEYSVPLPGIPEGNHSLTVYATSFAQYGHNANSATSQALIDFSIDCTPPRISGLSVENKTYNSSELPLSFVVDEKTSQISYSMDNQAKVIVDGNTTLRGLTYGNHNLTIYAVDSAGNTGESETISFSVETPFPLLLTAALVSVAVAVTVVAVVVAVVYWKKRKQ